jgi:hypothetical protein
MFKKIRDKVNEATQQGAARGAQEFQQHAEQFRRAAAAQGYDITPQLPTPQAAAQAFRSLTADPDTAAFLALPMRSSCASSRNCRPTAPNCGGSTTRASRPRWSSARWSRPAGRSPGSPSTPPRWRSPAPVASRTGRSRS